MKNRRLIALSLLVLASSGCVAKVTRSLSGHYVLIAGGYNERLVLDLKEDWTYTLWHSVDFHDIAGQDRGSWSFAAGIVALKPTVHGAADGDEFLPYHCARLRVQERGTDVLLISESVPLVPAATPERAVLIKQKPNKALEPTPPAVTRRAAARRAPAGVVAHL